MDHQAASGTYFVSRTELLKWVNSVLPAHIADQLKITKVEQCASGVVYAVLLSFVFPRHSPMIMSRVKMGAKSEYECRHNVKLVQDILSRNDVSRLVEVDRIAKGNYQANLEFLQWLKTFSETQAGLFGGGMDADDGGGIDETHHHHHQHDQTGTSRGDDTARSSILAGSGTYNNNGGGGGSSSSPTSSPNHARLSVGGGGGGNGSPRKSVDYSSLDTSGRDRTPTSKSSTLHSRGPIRSSPAAAATADNSHTTRSSMAKSPSHQQRMAATTAPGFGQGVRGASPAGKGGSFVRSRSPRMVPARSTSPLDEEDDGPTLITPSTRGPTSSSLSPKPKSSTTFRQAPFNPNPQSSSATNTTNNAAPVDPQETPVVLPRLDTQHAAEKLEKDRRRSIAAGVTNGRQAGTARYQDPASATGSSSPGGGLRAGRDWYVSGDEEGHNGGGKPQGGGGFLMDSSDDGDVQDSLNDTGASSTFGAFPLETGKPGDQQGTGHSSTSSVPASAEGGDAEQKKKAVAAAVAAAQAKKQKRESFGGGAAAISAPSKGTADTFLNDSLTNDNNSSPLLLAGSGSTHNMSGRKDSDSGSAGNWLLSSLPKGALGSPTTGPEDPLDDELPSSTPPPTAVPRFSDQLSDTGSPISQEEAAVAGGRRLGKAPVAGMSRSAANAASDPTLTSPPGKRPGTKGFQTTTLVNADAQHSPLKGPVMGTPRGSRVDDALREVKERVRSASRGGDRGGSLNGGVGGNVAASSSSPAASPGGNTSSPGGGERRTSSGAVPAVVSLKAATPALGRTSSSLPNTPRIYENGRSPTGGSSPESNSSSTLQAPAAHAASSPVVPASTGSSNAASTTTAAVFSSPPLGAPPKMTNGHHNNQQQTSAAVPPTTKKASSEESASTQIEGSPSQVQQERDFYLDKLLLIEEAIAALSPSLSSTAAAASLPSRGRSPASPPPPLSTAGKGDGSAVALADRITAILSSKDNNLPPLKKLVK